MSVRPLHEQIIWAAGFFDGEGCIVIERRGPDAGVLQISVGQARPEPLARFAALFGGRPPRCELSGARLPDGSRKPFWRWSVSSALAGAALRELSPFLVVKREQALAALEFQADRSALQGAAAGLRLKHVDRVSRRATLDHYYRLLQELKRGEPAPALPREIIAQHANRARQLCLEVESLAIAAPSRNGRQPIRRKLEELGRARERV